MKKQIIIAVLFGALVMPRVCVAASGPRDDLTEAMKDSIVYLETSAYAYDLSEPWKRRGVAQSWACACAVGDYEVVTTAESVENLAFLRALRYGQNEFVGATLKIVDYEANLCLISLDPKELNKPLKPLKFAEEYAKGAEVDSYWLSSDSHMLNARGYLDRASVERTRTSYGRRLRYVIGNTSQSTGHGEVYCVGSAPVGIACWSTRENESGLIPAEAINAFLTACKADEYKGFGEVGFVLTELLDPAMRSFLNMPDSLKDGAYVADVQNLGTACGELKKGDVVLKIDGNTIDSYGRFEHPKYKLLSFHHLITSRLLGETLTFEIWRDGGKQEIKAQIRNFKPSEMLVPYYEYDRQPEYVVTGGFVLQKLTREYMLEYGDNMAGEAPPHLFHYYRDSAFKPTPERRDIVVLSYVLPAQINLGYNGLGRLVVSKFNGMTIRSIADIPAARKLNPDSRYDVIEFELDSPAVVIPREQLAATDALIARNYGITKLSNINP